MLRSFLGTFFSYCVGVRYDLGLARLLGVAADDLDLLCREFLVLVRIALESYILDEEGPYIVAESIRF